MGCGSYVEIPCGQGCEPGWVVVAMDPCGRGCGPGWVVVAMWRSPADGVAGLGGLW